MGIDISRLGPDAQRQIARQIAARQQRRITPHAKLPKDAFDSNGEREFYLAEVLPGLHNGTIAKCELHREFELYPAAEFCGKKFPAAVFKPDFVLHYRSGSVEVVEIKSKFTKKKSRDYTLRRRLFIERYALPNGWLWREIVTDERITLGKGKDSL